MSVSEPQKPILKTASLYGNIHQSTGQIVSQMITAGAAMLAFFFTFQAIMIVNFPRAISEIKTYQIGSVCIGKWALAVICVTVISFNLWSLSVIVSLLRSFKTAVKAGAEIEKEIGIDGALFQSFNTQNRGFRSTSFFLTCVTMGLICAIWAFYMFVALA